MAVPPKTAKCRPVSKIFPKKLKYPDCPPPPNPQRRNVSSATRFGAVTWHPMLTLQNSKSIERVQKSALAIILSPNYRSYDEALAKTELERLDRRREKLSLNFAKKAAKHPEHSNWFCKQDLNTNMQTRSTKAPYKPVQARTQRLLNSPIPYFTQLLNADATKTNNVP